MTAQRARSTALLTCAAVGLLLAAAPTPGAALHQVTATATTADPIEPLLGALSLAAWASALWLATTVLATVAGSLPGRAGRIGSAVSRRIAPTAVRRTVELTLGVTVAVSALGASSASAAAAPTPLPTGRATASATSTPTTAIPPLDWPTAARSQQEQSLAPTGASGSPAPDGQAVAAPSPPPSGAVSGPLVGGPSEPVPAASSRTAATRHGAAAGPGPVGQDAASSVLVRPRDSLWSISRAQLQAGGRTASDAAVAQAWPQWWAANRQLIGDDPDLLQPGTTLSPPG